MDVAGRVDRFKARQAAAGKKSVSRSSKPGKSVTTPVDTTDKLKQLKKELEQTPAKPAESADQ